MHHQIKQWVYLFYLFIFFFIYSVGLSEQIDDKGVSDSQTLATVEDESSESFKEYKFGTWSYYSIKPVMVDDHLKKIDEELGHDIYGLFKYSWDMQIKQKQLQLSSLDNERKKIKNEIIENLQKQMRLSIFCYERAHINIIEYVDPYCIPKDIAWRFGSLFALYGYFQKEKALYHLDSTVNMQELTMIKVLNFYKLSLLYLSYSLGLRNSSFTILQHNNLEDIVSDSNLMLELDHFFQKEFFFIDETLWLQKIEKLDQQKIEHICIFFRSFYQTFLQNRKGLSSLYISLAAHLSSITTKILLLAQSKANNNLDAIHPWMFKLFIDLKKWEMLQQQDQSFVTPDLATLLPQVQKECFWLLPSSYQLEDIREENEYTLCEKVRMRNLLSSPSENLEKKEKMIEEFEFNPIAIREAFIDILHFFDKRASFLKGHHIAIQESNELIQHIYNYLSGYIELDALSITQDNALNYLLYIRNFDAIMEMWSPYYHVDDDYFGGIYFDFIGFDQFYFPRITFELRKYILKFCPFLESFKTLTTSVNPIKDDEEKSKSIQKLKYDSEKLR